MQQDGIETWIRNEAIKRGCCLVGIAKITKENQMDFLKPPLIEATPAKYVIILAMALEDPIQDCWTHTPSWQGGKSYLDEVIGRVASAIALKLTLRGYPSRTLSYGGSYLKYIAVHAVLGVIGRNNLLITPEYGPHLRLRGLLTTAPLNPSQRLLGEYNPCNNCPDTPPCLEACPSGAFKNFNDKKISKLVPRSGYDKELCRIYSTTHLQEISPYTYLWCRACEAACPVGTEKFIQKD